MTSKPPRVPPANRSSKGTGSTPAPGASDVPEQPERVADPAQQGRSANTKQNTIVQGSHGKRDRGARGEPSER